MVINIKARDVEDLLDDVVKITGETKTEALRKALEERYQRLVLSSMIQEENGRFYNFLAQEIWPHIPAELLGSQMSKEETEEILGLGESGV